jgi:hypothetical protein
MNGLRRWEFTKKEGASAASGGVGAGLLWADEFVY